MAKSPFAKQDVKTYVYPAPLNDEKREGELDAQYQIRRDSIDPEVESAEQKERPWLKIRIPRSRGDVDAVADRTQSIMAASASAEVSWKQQIAQGNREVFELLVEDWSFDVEFGAKPTSENYAKLDTWAGEWVSACLADALRRGTQRDFRKSTPDSSTEPENSGAKPSVPVPAASPSE